MKTGLEICCWDLLSALPPLSLSSPISPPFISQRPCPCTGSASSARSQWSSSPRSPPGKSRAPLQGPLLCHWDQAPLLRHWGQPPILRHWGQPPILRHWGQPPLLCQWGQSPLPRQWRQAPLQSLCWVPCLSCAGAPGTCRRRTGWGPLGQRGLLQGCAQGMQELVLPDSLLSDWQVSAPLLPPALLFQYCHHRLRRSVL